MALPRSKYVQEGQEGVYHCYCRCVRGAFLCGYDKRTGRDYSHRKQWIIDRMQFLATVFAIEIGSYSVMENHYHNVLRLLPDLVGTWSDLEVARRWLTLFPGRRSLNGDTASPSEEAIFALADRPERIAELRRRLCSLSWFMGQLNEYIARKANKEDGVKGRFWESRYKCQALLDEAAIAACMVYVDLNPIRAGVVATPEESDYTSIQERIRIWRREMATLAAVPTEGAQDTQSEAFDSASLSARETSSPVSACTAPANSSDDAAPSTSWLCPISSTPERRGILRMTETEYFELVDMSGRMLRSDKRGAINPDLAPILLRIGAKPEAWIETVSRFGSKFHLAAGLLANLRSFADRIGSRWLKGIASARAAFISSLPQSA